MRVDDVAGNMCQALGSEGCPRGAGARTVVVGDDWWSSGRRMTCGAQYLCRTACDSRNEGSQCFGRRGDRYLADPALSMSSTPLTARKRYGSSFSRMPRGRGHTAHSAALLRHTARRHYVVRDTGNVLLAVPVDSSAWAFVSERHQRRSI